MTGSVPTAPLVTGTLPPVEVPGTSTTTTDVATGQPCASWTLTAANFNSRSAALTYDVASSLDELAALLKRHPGRVVVYGYADRRPTTYRGGNVRLSLDRATAVVNGLIDRGIPRSRFVRVEGKGTRDPVASGDTPADYALNRRVEIFVLCP